MLHGMHGSVAICKLYFGIADYDNQLENYILGQIDRSHNEADQHN